MKMYEELIKDLRENHGKYFARDMEAADAIEELSKPVQQVPRGRGGKRIDLTQDSIEKIADAVVRKLTAEDGE